MEGFGVDKPDSGIRMNLCNGTRSEDKQNITTVDRMWKLSAQIYDAILVKCVVRVSLYGSLCLTLRLLFETDWNKYTHCCCSFLPRMLPDVPPATNR